MTSLAAQGGSDGARPMVTAIAGLALATLPAATVLAFGHGTAALAAVLVFAVAGTGPGLVCWLDAGDGLAQAGLIVVASLTLFAGASTALIWLHAWTPSLLWILAAASVLSCLVRLHVFRRKARA